MTSAKLAAVEHGLNMKIIEFMKQPEMVSMTEQEIVEMIYKETEVIVSKKTIGLWRRKAGIIIGRNHGRGGGRRKQCDAQSETDVLYADLLSVTWV